MNKNTIRLKKLILIFITVFLILIAIQKLPAAVKKEPKALASFKKEQTTTIDIIDGINKTTLKRNGKQWFVKETSGNKDVLADQQRVDNLIETITTLKKTEAVSQNSKNYSRLEVDGRRSIKVEYKERQWLTGSRDKSVILYVGKADSLESSYFRVDSDKLVYRANVDLARIIYPIDFRSHK